MRHYLLGRTPAGRDSHLKRLNMASPGEYRARDTLPPHADDIDSVSVVTITVVQRLSVKATETSSPAADQASSVTPSSVSSSSSLATPSLISSPSLASPISTPAMAATSDATNVNPTSSPSPASQSRRLSKGSEAAIGAVLGSLVLLCLVFFIARKCFIHKRMRKRVTWTAGMPMPVSSDDYVFRTNVAPTSLEKPRRVPVPSYTPSDVAPPASARRSIPIPSAPVLIVPPPTSYNNDNPRLSARSQTQRSPAGSTPKHATVQFTFIPSLPDELTISTAETLVVLAEFDDGWGLCVNRMGDQGMVPLECLVYPESSSGKSEHRHSGRASSLQIGVRTSRM